MLWTQSTKLGQATKNGTSGDTSVPIRDLAGWNTPSVHVFVCGAMVTEGERQLHHLLTVSLCPYVQQHYLSSLHREWDAWNSCWNCVCVCVSSYICQLRGIIHQSESSCTLSVSIGLVIGFCLNLAKKFPPQRRERHFVCPFSLSVGDVMDRGVCVSWVNKSI